VTNDARCRQTEIRVSRQVGEGARRIHNPKSLHVIASLDPAGGGPVENLRHLVTALQNEKIDSEVACLDEPGSPWLRDFPGTVYALGRGRGTYRISYAAMSWLRENISKYDVVFIRGLWQFHGYAVRRALRGLSIPYFVFPHGMLDPWFQKGNVLKYLKKQVYWLSVEGAVVRNANGVLFTSTEELVRARSCFWPYRAKEQVVPYGTAHPPGIPSELRRRFLEEFPALLGKRIVLFMGRLQKKKGADLLLEAFCEVCALRAEFSLVFVGPDEDGTGAVLQSRCVLRGLSGRIQFLGMLTGERKWSALHAAEVFALPSHQENFGIAVAEALACGKPVLISNKVNIWREIIADGAGFVAEDNLEGTIELLQKWVSVLGAERDAMARRAIDCFRNRYDIKQTAAALGELVSSSRSSVALKG
jgi:glycosyltransferase involved in cell wall biosynthesis